MDTTECKVFSWFDVKPLAQNVLANILQEKGNNLIAFTSDNSHLPYTIWRKICYGCCSSIGHYLQ